MYDRKTNRQRPFCFADFACEADLEEALQMNGRTFKSVVLRMNRAGQKEESKDKQLLSVQTQPRLNVRTEGLGLNVNATEWMGSAAPMTSYWTPEVDPQVAQSSIWTTHVGEDGMPMHSTMENGHDGFVPAWHEQDYQGYEDFQFVDQVNDVWMPPNSALEFPHSVSWEETMAGNAVADLGRTLWVGGMTGPEIEEEDFKEWFKGVCTCR